MGRIGPYPSAKLFCGLLARELPLMEAAVERLELVAGKTDYWSLPFLFGCTRYYEQELGADLQRVFVSFVDLVDPSELGRFKIEANRIEEELAETAPPHRRRVNIDPGCLTMHSVILASTKNFQHRIPIGRGIYAEQELLFTKVGVRLLPWTYPDYRAPVSAEIFRQIRGILMERLRA